MSSKPYDIYEYLYSPLPVTDFSDDLLILILEHLARISHHTLKACSAVCHRFYKLAIPIIWNNNLDIRNSKDDRKLRRLLNPNSQLPLFVQYARLLDNDKNGSDDAEPLVQLVKVAKNLKNIEIHGSYQVSQWLMDEINENIPNAKITVHAQFPYEEDDWYRGWTAFRGPLEGGMNGFSSPQLHSLHIDSGWEFDGQGPPVVRRSLEKIVKNCPNLRHFISERRNLRELELNLSYDDTLPQLESFAYIPLSSRTLDVWGEITGWKTLKVLKVSTVDMFCHFARFDLPTLESLTLADPIYDGWRTADQLNALPKFKAPIRSLGFCMVDGEKLPHPFLCQFSQTLIELTVRNSHNVLECPFSGAEIRLLRDSCPKLQKLGVRPRVDRESPKWPCEAFEELACFNNLQHLAVHLPGLEDDSRTARFEDDDRPSSVRCLDTHKKIYEINPASQLLHLAFIDLWDSADSFDEIMKRSRYRSIRLDDEFVFRGRGPSHWDYSTFSRFERSPQLELSCRPFKQMYNFDDSDCELDHSDNVLWFAKQLGPGPDWARRELLPRGLMREEHFKENQVMAQPAIKEAAKKVMKDEEQILKHRRIVTQELMWWKARWELEDRYGKYWCLYDVLYPRRKD